MKYYAVFFPIELFTGIRISCLLINHPAYARITHGCNQPFSGCLNAKKEMKRQVNSFLANSKNRRQTVISAALFPYLVYSHLLHAVCRTISAFGRKSGHNSARQLILRTKPAIYADPGTATS